jgi:hypothetical protein
MKNIQVIDGAMNCAYHVYAVTDEEFLILFPEPGQDIEFIEDVIKRVGENNLEFLSNVWRRRVNKPDAIGIHGTLFYELTYKKKYYPGKKSSAILE